MKSYVTSFVGLFEPRGGSSVIERVEIPLIQRDYAQGRRSTTVEEIRSAFLDVLHDAIADPDPTPVDLDFVYGDVTSGRLQPLDGQQRLTTLFLLHWYIAFRAGRLAADHRWKHFTYETRLSARYFCQRLVNGQTQGPQVVVATAAWQVAPSRWIEDQPWYLYVWRHDPTIQSMLVMIDAIDARFGDLDFERAWARLTDPDKPAVSFHLLPITDLGSGEDLYIKMNSRGKPLTPFENFKARFEKSLEGHENTAAVDTLAHRIDSEWADVLWPYRGEDDIVDDEFIRYIDYLTEICEWRERNVVRDVPLGKRAEHVFGSSNSLGPQHLDFLIKAFDTWHGTNISAVFSTWFTTSQTSERNTSSRVRLFGRDVRTDLFDAACHTFGDVRGKVRVFPLSQSLLLYAVLIHRIHATPDFPRRVRNVRNLLEASTNEIRLDVAPDLLVEVEAIIKDGDLEAVRTFNQNQLDDERAKSNFLRENPHLEEVVFRLENHPILRGSLSVFDLDPRTFEARALTFERLFSDATLWPDLTGALLATGEYQRKRNATQVQFGTGSAQNENSWRELLTGPARARNEPTRRVLSNLLDRLADAGTSIGDQLAAIQSEWLANRDAEQQFDWRYYFVKYDVMRDGNSGIYATSDGELGYSVCMLDRTQMNSNYRDPYLSAILALSGAQKHIASERFTGSAQNERWLQLTASGSTIRCVEQGFHLKPPADRVLEGVFQRVCASHGAENEYMLRVKQIERNGRLVDTADRIKVGAALLEDLVRHGL
jgi:hypothetical protein